MRSICFDNHPADRIAHLAMAVVVSVMMVSGHDFFREDSLALLISLALEPAPSHNGKVNREPTGKMNIGQASEQTGVSAKMIRYYESIGLLPAAARRANGYRDYSDQDVAVLQFVRRTRDLGFSLEEVAALLALWSDKKRTSREVKRLAETHIADLERRISEMRAVMKTLRKLTQHCHGDERSECPILDDLAKPRSPRARAPSKGRARAS